jgi:predicted nucleotidyltransferase
MAQALAREDRRVLAVGLFGSLARNRAVPSSDADVLIALESHGSPR